MAKYNWSSIRKRYIKSPVQIGARELASIFHIKSHALVLRFMERDHWKEQRDKYWSMKTGNLVTIKETEEVTTLPEIIEKEEIPENEPEIVQHSNQIIEPEPEKLPEKSDRPVKPKKPVQTKEEKIFEIHVESKINRAQLASNMIKNAMLEMSQWFEQNRDKNLPFPEDRLLKISGYVRNADTILNNLIGNNNTTVNNQINILNQQNTQVNNTVIDAKSDESRVIEILDEIGNKTKLIK